MKQENEIAELASLYIRFTAPGVIVYFWSSSYNAVATAIGKPKYNMYATMGASIIHWTLAYYLAV